MAHAAVRALSLFRKTQFGFAITGTGFGTLACRMSDRDSMPRILATGLGAALIVFAASYGLSAPFDPETYGSWIAFIGILSVPSLLIVGGLWRYRHPAVLAGLGQPWRGLAFLALTGAGMGLAALFLYFGPGGGAGVTPFLINAAILSIVSTFWVVGLWECWPLNRWIANPILLGIAAWITAYLLADLAFHVLFDFAEARHAPFYRPSLDPGGLFPFWTILVFAVTTSAIIVAWEKLLGLWPLHGPMAHQHPLRRGLTASALVIAASGLWMGIACAIFGMDAVDFMLRGPIALLFGIFFAINLTQSRLFAGLAQPGRGACLIILAYPLGLVLEELYRIAAPAVAGVPMPPGGPRYELELWVATALLAVTFPLIVIATGCFDFWPLKRTPAGPGAR